jgi:hypothetical protein
METEMIFSAHRFATSSWCKSAVFSRLHRHAIIRGNIYLCGKHQVLGWLGRPLR